MIKEYINQLADENNQTLDKLEKQMKELLNVLSSAEQWSETLQRENNAQTNIFSPRNLDTEIGQKIEKAIHSVSQIKQEIEYVRDLMETHLQKKAEYEKMLAELDKSSKQENVNNKEIYSEKEENNQIVLNDSEQQSNASREELKKFLSELYSKTELCLALLNGNKNRCKKELNSMKQEIKTYVEMVEKEKA